MVTLFLFDVTGPWSGSTTSCTTFTSSLMLMHGSGRLTSETVSPSTSPGSDYCGACPSSLDVDGELFSTVATGIGPLSGSRSRRDWLIVMSE